MFYALWAGAVGAHCKTSLGSAALRLAARADRRSLLFYALWAGAVGALPLLLAGLGWMAMTQPMIAPVAVEAPSLARPDLLERHVRALAEELPPRSDDPANLEESAAYIEDQLRTHTDRVGSQRFDVRGGSYRNVIARFPGRTPNAPLLVIGAHYDTAGGLPGADDNASGVAGLLELARAFAQYPPTPPVELVAYALEEPPHFGSEDMGSHHHARGLAEGSVDVAAMISLEMLGYFSDDEDSQEFPVAWMESLYPSTGNFIALVSNLDHRDLTSRLKKAMLATSQVPVYSINAPAVVPGIDYSDHRNYWIHGYPALMVTDTAFYRNRNYHTEKDTPDTLDYTRLAQVVDAVFYAVERVFGASPPE